MFWGALIPPSPEEDVSDKSVRSVRRVRERKQEWRIMSHLLTSIPGHPAAGYPWKLLERAWWRKQGRRFGRDYHHCRDCWRRWNMMVVSRFCLRKCSGGLWSLLFLQGMGNPSLDTMFVIYGSLIDCDNDFTRVWMVEKNTIDSILLLTHSVLVHCTMIIPRIHIKISSWENNGWVDSDK